MAYNETKPSDVFWDVQNLSNNGLLRMMMAFGFDDPHEIIERCKRATNYTIAETKEFAERTGYQYDEMEEFNASTKKSKHGTFTRIASDLRNLSLVEEESLTESLNDYGVNADISTLTMAFNMADAYTTHREEELDRRYNGDEFYASAKKSIPDTKMSFTDNVNKMRVNNYARTGNINTVMKKRD